MRRVPLNVMIAIGVAVAFYAAMIWAAQIAWVYEYAPMGIMAGACFVAAGVSSIAAIILAEDYRGNH